jgi:hypothetical protein
MGRPPLFKHAMSNTERSRRRRAGYAATRAAPKPAEPATKLAPEEEIARLKARIAELERRQAPRARPRRPKS